MGRLRKRTKRRDMGASPSAPVPAPDTASRQKIRQALSGGSQPKIPVSSPGDASEHQAERMAEAALRAPAPESQTDVKSGSAAEGTRSDSLGLPDPIRTFFENRYGLDFGGVRMHTDGEAARQADQLDARAFTHGQDISFGRGEYAPHTDSGRRLLAHELAHVAQQKEGIQPRIFRQPKLRTNWVLKEPPVQLQTGPTCWAAALASWLLVKGIVQQGFSARFLIDHYHGTACTDSLDALIGNANADVEAVFAQWHVQLDLGTTIAPADFNVATAKRLIEQHGHFILVLHSTTMHAMVVYGLEIDPQNPADFNLMVMDPLQGMRRVAPWAIEYDMSIGVGLPGGAGPAPCSLRRRS